MFLQKATTMVIHAYLTEINRTPLLSHTEERTLARRIAGLRSVYRRAVLSNPSILRRAVAILQDVQCGKRRIDQTLEVGLCDFLADRRTEDPLRGVEREEKACRAAAVQRTLNPQERKVIDLRFGLTNGSERSLSDIGRMLSLSRERIRQIEAAPMKKMRRAATTLPRDLVAKRSRQDIPFRL
jgi:DNA-directed RNA polymerase sigma subunit (sigma70/sigma32)